MTDHTKGDDWLPGLTDPVEIGRGGFGVVYKATETDLNRTVAVKILSGNLDELALQRFDRERRAMGALSGHPNIVAIYRTGLTGDDRPYLVMEFLQGGSLAEQVAARGPVSWKEISEVGVRLSAALETAHRAGVLHRDVKPENVFVSDLGAPKLGDFGIARLEGAPQTRSATITASFAHASPELIDGRPPSVQSDIYALASTLLTLMNGRPPFVRDTDESIVPLLARIATEPVPDLRSDGVPDALCQVFETAMAKDPGHRYSSTADFGRALQAAQRGLGVGCHAPRGAGRRPDGEPRVGCACGSRPDDHGRPGGDCATHSSGGTAPASRPRGAGRRIAGRRTTGRSPTSPPFRPDPSPDPSRGVRRRGSGAGGTTTGGNAFDWRLPGEHRVSRGRRVGRPVPYGADTGGGGGVGDPGSGGRRPVGWRHP